ncbi:nucleoid-structuring protein H-NS [Pseudomonas sp. ADAK18]|uniref:nucleoid-structuring protein H-NS n=1 Tax=Pseudomonas sp. ADAK18 TaxID=2730848 RepID=UPI00146409E4|nr:nucleoid-structuring protein H-NS [Pseudomonas sp. ADAK18]QJI27171.1 nucleoid-structuring protein H-NS [Pseudomonas sp. ADAK18]
MPHHSAPRLGSVCPHSGIAPWARRDRPSMAVRGYPGIHAGVPTTQYLRAASVV